MHIAAQLQPSLEHIPGKIWGAANRRSWPNHHQIYDKPRLQIVRDYPPWRSCRHAVCLRDFRILSERRMQPVLNSITCIPSWKYPVKKDWIMSRVLNVKQLGECILSANPGHCEARPRPVEQRHPIDGWSKNVWRSVKQISESTLANFTYIQLCIIS